MLETQLLIAAQSGNFAKLKTYIKRLQYLAIDHRNHLGQTALLLAAAGGHAKCVRLLLERGALPDICDSLGQSPLLLAARNRHRECVRLLLSAHAELSPAAIAALEDIHYTGIAALRQDFFWTRRKALLVAYYRLSLARLRLI